MKNSNFKTLFNSYGGPLGLFMSKKNTGNATVINFQARREMKQNQLSEKSLPTSFAQELETLAFEPYESWGNKLHAALGLPPLTPEEIRDYYETQEKIKKFTQNVK